MHNSIIRFLSKFQFNRTSKNCSSYSLCVFFIKLNAFLTIKAYCFSGWCFSIHFATTYEMITAVGILLLSPSAKMLMKSSGKSCFSKSSETNLPSTFCCFITSSIVRDRVFCMIEGLDSAYFFVFSIEELLVFFFFDFSIFIYASSSILRL